MGACERTSDETWVTERSAFVDDLMSATPKPVLRHQQQHVCHGNKQCQRGRPRHRPTQRGAVRATIQNTAAQNAPTTVSGMAIAHPAEAWRRAILSFFALRMSDLPREPSEEPAFDFGGIVIRRIRRRFLSCSFRARLTAAQEHTLRGAWRITMTCRRKGHTDKSREEVSTANKQQHGCGVPNTCQMERI